MLLAIAFLSAVMAILTTAVLTMAQWKIRRLRTIPIPATEWQAPAVSIIVAARNESRDIEQAMRSLLQLPYKPLQITIVNDRSTDETGQILDRLAAAHPRLNVVHLQSLPDGWLGKNYAQHLGAQRSDGRWLLFTDADIVFQPTALQRAVWLAEEQGLDHLAATPKVNVQGFLLNALVATFAVFFKAYFRPWRARNPRSKAFIGIGAFNLVRAEAYQQIGGHERLRMRPDDDVKLGKVLKHSGFSQDFVVAPDMLSVRWYGSVGELICGLEKNSFAGVEYNPWTVIASTATVLLFHVGPFIGVFLTTGLTQILFAIAVGLWWFCCAQACRDFKQSSWYGVGYPVAALLLVYVQWRTMILNYWLGGIRWRDTFYSLDELRKNRV